MNEKTTTTVREAMDTEVVIIDGMATISEAIGVMVAKKTSTLIIDKRHDQDEYGILLAADIANHVLAQNKAPERINAYEIMSKPILFVRPDMDIRYCSRFFKRFGISQAPVIDHGTIIGIVSYDSMIIKGMTR
jgi:predicted transcriptional regulator